jgi:hypothetical protein
MIPYDAIKQSEERAASHVLKFATSALMLAIERHDNFQT